ncbi:MAG TPA: tyrosine-type recombinase/integrase [Ilumatobacteraceae bacterium]|nr:tyrosine-type recombinase/integrase [Ilumatobacteraceae bacterium]
MTAVAQPAPMSPDKIGDDWQVIAARAPRMASTMGRYLTQTSTFLAPRTIDASSIALRQLALWLLEHTDVTAIGAVTRNDIEDFILWLADQPGQKGPLLSTNTRSQRIHMLRSFFARIIEWDWDDAPRRNPVLKGDLPSRPDSLPKFLDDAAAAKLMATARAATDPRDRLVVELLARIGLRAREATGLDADAVVRVGDGHWLRVPVGKLRNDRFVPLHPQLVELLDEWCATNVEHIRAHRRLLADHRGSLSYDALLRIVKRTAKRAGIGHVHPHQLRHTLATQAINRGMRLEAIAALLGHRSMRMTLTYARIADRVVADEYAAVTEQLDSIYGPTIEASLEPANMARLRREAHARMLGNGMCTRPVELNCRMESACETCSYFSTGPEFVPVLLRQRDHARDHHQPDRAALFDTLITRANEDLS